MSKATPKIQGHDFISQTSIDGFQERNLDVGYEAGIPQEQIDRMLREWKGGKCSVCGIAYEKKHTINRYADFVWFKACCTCEATDDAEHLKSAQVASLLKQARIPIKLRTCDFAGWDYGVTESINHAFKDVYQYAKKCRFREQGLILYGDVGTGKTHCAIACLREMAIAGMTIFFVPMADLVQDLVRSGDKFQRDIAFANAVLFDDMDKVGTSKSEWVRERVFAIIDERLSNGRIILGTTNFQTHQDFEQKFGDAIMSRIIAACQITKFTGEDYRPRLRKTRE